MDENNYKQTKTKRGFSYTYYYSPPTAGKPVLFFSHGFPPLPLFGASRLHSSSLWATVSSSLIT
jgi:hypothetical protein